MDDAEDKTDPLGGADGDELALAADAVGRIAADLQEALRNIRRTPPERRGRALEFAALGCGQLGNLLHEYRHVILKMKDFKLF